MSSLHELESTYLSIVRETRERITRDDEIAWLLSDRSSEIEVLGFLLHFCGLGVKMVEPVEGWILRAGQACERKGYVELGEQLQRAAGGEAGHHTMMLADLEVAASLWNARYAPPVAPADILGMPPTDAIERYIEIHESNIAGEHPYCQLGIEHEIETMSLILGPPLMTTLKRVVRGADGAISFIREHVELDVTHTADGIQHIVAFSSAHPEALERIAHAGSRALGIYLDFLGECIDLGRALARRSAPLSREDA